MSKCSFIMGDNGRLDKFTRQARDRCIREVIEPMARDGLRTISVAYRDFVLGKAEIMGSGRGGDRGPFNRLTFSSSSNRSNKKTDPGVVCL